MNLFVIWSAVLIFASPSFAQLDDSQELLRRIDQYRVPYDQFLVRTRLTAYAGDKVQETALFDAYIDGHEKSLVVQKEGKNRDMKILYVEEKMWVQLPGSHRPIRITPVQRLMGQASNGDVAMVSYGDDYIARFEGEDTAGGVDCRKLLLTARKKSATYHKIILFVRKIDYRPVKAEFFLVSGKHFKTAYYQTYTRIGDQTILIRMTINDEMRKEEKTVFEYEMIQEKVIDAKYFNKNYLVHVSDL
jgi:hypothetical protein